MRKSPENPVKPTWDYTGTIYRRFPFARFFGAVTDAGSQSFTGSEEDDSSNEVVCRVSEGADGGTDESFFSASSANAEAAAISSGLTSSPLLKRAAITGVTRMRRTLV